MVEDLRLCASKAVAEVVGQEEGAASLLGLKSEIKLDR